MRCDPSVEANRITLQAFINEFVSETNSESGTRYCFVLGAGASRDSGIRTAGELAMEWLRQIHANRGIVAPFEKWLKDPAAISPAEPDKFEHFEPSRAAEFYFDVYDLYCAGDPKKGYRALNDEIEGKEPSFGYSVLACILSTTQNKVVITVNFDNLVADALFVFSGKTPLVCPHESLARFIPSNPTRPIVAKIHRDRFYDPKSSREDTGYLEEAWQDTLRGLFHSYKPIFVGYGGNDRSLMTFLEKSGEHLLPNGYFWLVYDPSLEDPDKPEQELPPNIAELIKKHPGNWVPSVGFDSLMILLHRSLNYPFVHEQILEKATQRKNAYMESVKRLCEKHNLEPPKTEEATAVRDALATSVKESRTWIDWWQRASQEKDLAQKIAILSEGISNLPDNAELYNLRGNRYYDKGEYDLALLDYSEAIRIAPEDSAYYSNRAGGYIEKGLYDLALADCDQAIRLNPRHANGYFNRSCAHFLMGNSKLGYQDLEEAIKLDPGLRVKAKTDSDFDSVRKEPRFRKLVYGEE